MVWNMDMVDEAGLAVNSNATMTWQTFFNYADKLTKVDGNGVITRLGYDPKNGQNSRLFTVAHQWDAPYFPMEGKPSLNQPNLIKMVEMNAERVFAKYGNWKNSTAWYDYFQANKVATLNLGIYAPGELDYRNKDIRYKISWPPSLSGRKVQQVNGWMLAIPTGVKNPDLSFKLIEFLSTDIQFQSDLYAKVGFLGGGQRFISKLASELRDPNRLWYVQSMSTADYIDAPRPDPMMSKADGLFKTAAESVWAGKQAAPAALDEANRLFMAELQKVGRL
jgi:ABC-type glycerol-3-phosphate transport system substrate-binding protein